MSTFIIVTVGRRPGGTQCNSNRLFFRVLDEPGNSKKAVESKTFGCKESVTGDIVHDESIKKTGGGSATLPRLPRVPRATRLEKEYRCPQDEYSGTLGVARRVEARDTLKEERGS